MTETIDNPRQALFDALGDLRAGMLGIEGSGQHMQPMSHFADRETATLWFVTHRDTDLAKSVGQGARAQFTIQMPGDMVYASMTGPITKSNDTEKLQEIWSPSVGAWFDGGPDSPEVVLLHMPLADAALWKTTANSFKIGAEIARAMMSDSKTPDVGDRVHIDFSKAA